MPPGRPLSSDEFSRLLQKAAERHVSEGPRSFTTQDLVEAGQELGIDRETVHQVYREHQAELERAQQRALSRPALRPLPRGSKLALVEEGEELTLVIPPRLGQKVGAVVASVFACGLFGFITTTGAPWPIMAAFGTIGAILIAVTVSAARTSWQLTLRRDGGGTLARVAGGRGTGTTLEPGQVHARLDERLVETQQGRRRVEFVALDHGTDTHELLEGYSRAEQAWAVDVIERWLGR